MSRLRTWCAVLMTFLLPALSLTSSLNAQNHVVPREELRSAIQSAARQRQANIDKITQLLQSPQVTSAAEKSGIRLEQVSRVVPLLSDEELARLSDRAEQIERDIAAGALTNQQITYILIALGTAVIVLILVD